jgi:hypothetical protein
MDALGWTMVGVAAAACLVPGVAAMATGWVIPWLRGQVLRPALWGLGEILLGAFMIWQAVMHSALSTHTGGGTVWLIGLPLGVLGFALMSLGQRPGRRSHG